MEPAWSLLRACLEPAWISLGAYDESAWPGACLESTWIWRLLEFSLEDTWSQLQVDSDWSQQGNSFLFFQKTPGVRDHYYYDHKGPGSWKFYPGLLHNNQFSFFYLVHSHITTCFIFFLPGTLPHNNLLFKFLSGSSVARSKALWKAKNTVVLCQWWSQANKQQATSGELLDLLLWQGCLKFSRKTGETRGRDPPHQ